MSAVAYTSTQIFDGTRLTPGALVVEDGRVSAVASEVPRGMRQVELGSGTIAPGFIDLQLNGGDGVMLNDAPTLETLERMAAAHGGLGATAIFPTLITDTPEQTRAAVEAAVAAIATGVPGIAGLHLEGPHLSLARKGAHDPALIRRMEDADLAFLVASAARLPRLMVTLAPESVSNDQLARLSAGGVYVSLGHTDADYDVCVAAAGAGARIVTHLFNAMSPLGNRNPGLVGAALDRGGLSAGLIADGIHVHPAAIRAALAAKRGPSRIFLVSDAMATAGSEITRFTLNGREILRRDGRLTLADGTLAGADLDMAGALRVMTRDVGTALDHALAMATSGPARAVGLEGRYGHLMPGRAADFVYLDDALRLMGVWRAGHQLKLSPPAGAAS
ncbi:N-acetylglucosamine-6-phosphate deacetylase [Albidovulum sediminicola]|uniref:N-acetylglucosamine-6-phosphate deacetylase n=1 Tax=Albidovulum sediminicola TaxID=2984331 RepID=A0ABT2Z3R4_9RHOB|nr:N-acetylglucosamine-6-phosphate deacetylase [Defluviimonas sp. WL0075]MCV2865736.1 N-acetylglucosamine-6-phosphate deacetylase [Defluviimonas sp. WL0075]